MFPILHWYCYLTSILALHVIDGEAIYCLSKIVYSNIIIIGCIFNDMVGWNIFKKKMFLIIMDYLREGRYQVATEYQKTAGRPQGGLKTW